MDHLSCIEKNSLGCNSLSNTEFQQASEPTQTQQATHQRKHSKQCNNLAAAHTTLLKQHQSGIIKRKARRNRQPLRRPKRALFMPQANKNLDATNGMLESNLSHYSTKID